MGNIKERNAKLFVENRNALVETKQNKNGFQIRKPSQD
jgi:hypothetical protein